MQSVWRCVCGCTVVAVTLLLPAGCRSGPEADRSPSQMISEPPPAVTLSPGDVIQLTFYYAQDLNTTVTVLPDGIISLQLVGDVNVTGKTPAELREELIKRYATVLKAPEVTVTVQSLFNRRIYVGGEVLTPGQLPLPGPLTALEAIFQAGGFNPRTAETANVIIIRHKDGLRYGCALDMRDAIAGKETKPFYLQQHDIVYVPRTPIVRANEWIDQYINKLIPNSGFQYLYSTDNATIGLRPYR